MIYLWPGSDRIRKLLISFQHFYNKSLRSTVSTPNSSYFCDKKTYVSLVQDFCAAAPRTASHRQITFAAFVYSPFLYVCIRHFILVRLLFRHFFAFRTKNGKLKLFPKREREILPRRLLKFFPQVSHFVQSLKRDFRVFPSSTFLKTGLINFFSRRTFPLQPGRTHLYFRSIFSGDFY